MLGDVWDDATLVRFYFHVTADSVVPLIGELTTPLNRYQVPFRMKALNDPLLYGRTDAMVLYVARRHYGITAWIVGNLPRSVTASLLESTPLFTDVLQPGVGIAEDPTGGESFGMHRCRLVAEGLVEAWQRGEKSVEGRLRAIAMRFERDELKLDRPHLNAGSTELVEIPYEVTFAYA
jgi:hypothetical protein